MKQILLAKKGKRILARFIDLIILFGTTILTFFPFIYPNVFNKIEFDNNSKEIITLYKDCDLFFVDDSGNYTAKSTVGTFKKVTDLYSSNLTFNGTKYENISLTKTLFDYYTVRYDKFGGNSNYDLSNYSKDILKVGSEESNIEFYDSNLDIFTLIDESKESITINFFLNTFDTACKNMISNSKVNELTNRNQYLMLSALAYILIVLGVYSFIFEFLIPLFSPQSKTIGKHIFKLGLVSLDGYQFKKSKLILRWLSYLFIEVILSFLTFGGVFLITYTMMLFTKKRRCIHDFCSGSVVIDSSNSIIFKNEKEEAYFLNRKNKIGNQNG